MSMFDQIANEVTKQQAEQQEIKAPSLDGVPSNSSIINDKADEPITGLILDTPLEKTIAEKQAEMSAAGFNAASNADLTLSNETKKVIDAELQERKEMIEYFQSLPENKPVDSETEEDEKEETEEEFLDKYGKAIVVIDKTGMGSTIDFTDEEHAKMEKVNKIVIEEVEEVALQSIKTKKKPKKSRDMKKLLNRKFSRLTSPVVAVGSGYTATMKGCSTMELLTFLQETNNPATDSHNEWSFIHSKIADTSLGEMDFTTFCSRTAYVDFSTFVYGIICATYPEMDAIKFQCRSCNKDFEHIYSNKSLIRAEEMSEDMQEKVADIVNNSTVYDNAIAYHREQAPVNTVKRIRLPKSDIIAEIQIQSAHDFINKSAESFTTLKDMKDKQASILATSIRAFYIEDDEDGEYVEIDETRDIIDVITELTDIDIAAISKVASDLVNGCTVRFGLMNIKCPHCGETKLSEEMDVKQLLFHKYQQAQATKIE